MGEAAAASRMKRRIGAELAKPIDRERCASRCGTYYGPVKSDADIHNICG